MNVLVWQKVQKSWEEIWVWEVRFVKSNSYAWSTSLDISLGCNQEVPVKIDGVWCNEVGFWMNVKVRRSYCKLHWSRWYWLDHWTSQSVFRDQFKWCFKICELSLKNSENWAGSNIGLFEDFRMAKQTELRIWIKWKILSQWWGGLAPRRRWRRKLDHQHRKFWEIVRAPKVKGGSDRYSESNIWRGWRWGRRWSRA